VARGEGQLGIQLISEIVFVSGAELLGPLPAELQARNVIGGNCHDRKRARRRQGVVQIPDLACRAAAAVITATGMNQEAREDRSGPVVP
jgi:hypothetical protein